MVQSDRVVRWDGRGSLCRRKLATLILRAACFGCASAAHARLLLCSWAPIVQSNENISPHVLRRVAKELAELVNDPPEGIKIHVNDDDITDIQASISGPGASRI